MVENYYLDLDLNLNIDISYIKHLDETLIDRHSVQLFQIPQDNYDQTLVNFLKNLGLNTIGAEIFFVPKNTEVGIHNDGLLLDDHCKLNWFFGSSGSVMRWYEPIDSKEISKNKTSIDTDYIYFEKHQCKEVCSFAVGKPTLVNVGLPHDAYNESDKEDLWILCYLLGNDQGNRITWSEASKHLNIYRK